MTIKNPLSKGRRTAIKKRIASKYTGKSTTRQRAKEAAKTGKKLSDIAGGGKKTGWSGKGVVKMTLRNIISLTKSMKPT